MPSDLSRDTAKHIGEANRYSQICGLPLEITCVSQLADGTDDFGPIKGINVWGCSVIISDELELDERFCEQLVGCVKSRKVEQMTFFEVRGDNERLFLCHARGLLDWHNDMAADGDRFLQWEWGAACGLSSAL